jgi:hypothetical protein
MNNKAALVLMLISIIGTACKTSFDDIKYTEGSADFTRVVAVGGSHFAGYSDRALYVEAQSNSIPAILATRFAYAGGGTFVQPMVNAGVGIGNSGNARYTLQIKPDPCSTGNIVVPLPIAATGDNTNYNWLGNSVVFNNLSVPNTRIKNVTNQSFGDPSPFLGNPLYARFASNPSSSTISGDALLVVPTFVMVWFGMEDVYNYARLGGEQGGDSITTAAYFDLLYNNLVMELATSHPGGVLLNIPSIDAFPFFTEVGYNSLLLDQAKATQLNNLYASVDTLIKFSAGYNPYVIEDPNVASGRRFIEEGEYILLSTPIDSINCQGWGTTLPIPGRYVLTAPEVLKINNAVIAFNSSITIAAATNNLLLVDIQKSMEKFRSGVVFNGVSYSTKYLSGKIFSTDGFHFSQRGSALIANEIVEGINNFYNAKLPKADVNSYDGIVYP